MLHVRKDAGNDEREAAWAIFAQQILIKSVYVLPKIAKLKYLVYHNLK